VVTASFDRTARLWDADTGKGLAVIRGHEGAIISAALSADGDRLVTDGGWKNGSRCRLCV